MKLFSDFSWRRGRAELGIIVLGVLIALYVDDWYTSVQQRTQEIGWVTGIRDDLLADQATLRSELESVAVSAAAIRELLADIDDPGTMISDPVKYLRTLKTANLTYFFRPTATTYTELISGANVSAITNRVLMRTVIEYHQRALLTDDLNEYFRKVRWLDYSAAVMNVLDPVVFAAVTEDWHRQAGSWPPDAESPDPLLVMESADLSALRRSEDFRGA